MQEAFLIAWREVKPVVLSLLGLTIVATIRRQWWVAGGLLGLLGWVAYFFRDPERLPAMVGDDLILAPADGRVTDIELVNEPHFIQGQAKRVSVFLSIFDVHVQRTPYPGQVNFLHYQPGSFAPAFLQDTHSNEANYIGILTDQGPLVVKQIAGILARRIVCWAELDAPVSSGQKLGLIKFGSRVDLYLPPTVEVLVAKGEQVYGGQTVMGRWREGR